MSNVFEKIAGNTKSGLLFIWPLGLLLAVFAALIMVEDYNTSRLGYLALPTKKFNYTWVPFVVGALPQIGQIVLFYIFGRDTKKGWALVIASLFFFIDVGTDTWYKSGQNWGLTPLAFVESVLIFTLGSEILFAIAVGFIAETFGEFIVTFTVFVSSVIEAVGLGLDALGLKNKRG